MGLEETRKPRTPCCRKWTWYDALLTLYNVLMAQVARTQINPTVHQRNDDDDGDRIMQAASFRKWDDEREETWILYV